MLATGNVPVQYKELPGGFRGTDETVKIMSKIAMGKWGTRSAKIRALALNIIRNVPEKDYLAEAKALARWVRLNIRYLKDPYGQETVSHPEETAFNTKAGDCDDQSVLLAALLGAVGIPTRFKVIGTTPVQYAHVYLQANPTGKGWITFDPIMTDKPEGWEVPKARRVIEKHYPVNGPDGWVHGMNGLQGQRKGHAMAGLGYIADPRVESHLDNPTIPRGAGTGKQPGREAGKPAYVVMPSFLDTDQGVDHMMAFPPNQNIPQRAPAPRAQQLRPQLQRSTVPGQIPVEIEDDAVTQAMHGQFETYGPDALADFNMDYIGAVNSQSAEPHMQVPTVRQAPEGVDVQFARSAMVLNPREGDKVEYYGQIDQQQRPPIRPYTEVAGLGEYQDMLPGMGQFDGMAGPGLAADATGNEAQPDAATTPVPEGAPAPSNTGKWLGVAALAATAYYLMKKR